MDDGRTGSKKKCEIRCYAHRRAYSCLNAGRAVSGGRGAVISGAGGNGHSGCALAVLFGLILLCAPGELPASDAKTDVAKPINCATAEGDIRVLESEKAHVAEQVLKGAMAVSPSGAVLGIITGTEKEHLSVGSGEYNQMIDDKIAAIKQKCGVK